MKRILTPILSLFVALSSCSGNKTESQATETVSIQAAVVNLSPQQFQEKSPNGVIIDVRTPAEIAQGKIAGSVAMDYYQPDFWDKVGEYPKDKEIYLYCAVGARSEDAAQKLIQQGYTKVYHLQGGIQAWYQNGLPISQE